MQDNTPPPELLAALRRMGIDPGRKPHGRRLTGGVSSDIWRMEVRGGAIVVKRALDKLRVAADWQAPVIRNRYEALWMQHAARAAPGCVPALLGQDEISGSLAMQYLPRTRHRLWKDMLRDVAIGPHFAMQVAAALVRIHAATAHDQTVAASFPTDDIFFAIRLDPYLIAAARAHPDRYDILHTLAHTTTATKIALVHGDVSPKNIMQGPNGPVFLDAECAWFGDPAFDAAFCLNHLLLKAIWKPPGCDLFLSAYQNFARVYLAGVTWEPRDRIEQRIAWLLPGLMLARVDGKSPVEYITTDAQRDIVRRTARHLLLALPHRLDAVKTVWRRELFR